MIFKNVIFDLKKEEIDEEVDEEIEEVKEMSEEYDGV